MNNAETTVREIAAAEPGATRIFEKFGIDYCCGGQKPLAQACAERAVEVETVLAALGEARQQPQAGDRDWATEPLEALCHHIEQTHHAFVRSEMERLQTLAGKVQARHGDAHPELAEIQRQIEALERDLLPHLRREELVLFPFIVNLERNHASNGPRPLGAGGSVRNPIRVMVAEHDAADAEMGAIRKLSQEYTPPENACPTYRAFYAALAEFEQDLHRHVHLENNILFPRAIELDEA